MKKQKIIAAIAVFLIAGTALAETPIGEAFVENVTSILEYEEIVNEAEADEAAESEAIPGEDVWTEPEEEALLQDTVEYSAKAPALATALSDKLADFSAVKDMAVFQETYNLDDEAIELFSEWIKGGRDTRLLMYIYEFWLTTNEDISIIGDIYDMFANNYIEDMHLPPDRDMWFEGIFNNLTGNRHGKISSDDVAKYIEAGLSVYDLKLAERMSRAGAFTVHEILDEKSSGKEWCDITADVYDISALKGRTELDTDSILDMLTLLKITNCDAEQILDIAKETPIFIQLENCFKEGARTAYNKLIMGGLWEYESAEEERAVRKAIANGAEPVEALNAAEEAIEERSGAVFITEDSDNAAEEPEQDSVNNVINIYL